MKRRISTPSTRADSLEACAAPAGGAAAGVSNPRLLEAIRRYREARALETATLLFDELRTATFLAVISKERAATRGADAQTGNTRTHDPPFAELREAGERLLPVFTDKDELKRFIPGRRQALVLPARDAMAEVLAKDYAALVIDPASPHRLQLDALFVRNVFRRM